MFDWMGEVALGFAGLGVLVLMWLMIGVIGIVGLAAMFAWDAWAEPWEDESEVDFVDELWGDLGETPESPLS